MFQIGDRRWLNADLRNLFLNLLSGADGIGRIHRADENFSVAVLAGPGAKLDGSDGGLQLRLFDDEREHDLWQFAVDPFSRRQSDRFGSPP
jgi:hypothetical protein